MSAITSSTVEPSPAAIRSSAGLSSSRSAGETPMSLRYESAWILRHAAISDVSARTAADSKFRIRRSNARARSLSRNASGFEPLAERAFSTLKHYFARKLDNAQANSHNPRIPPVTAVADDCLSIAARLPGCSDIPTSGFLVSRAPWIFREPRLAFFLEV
jgi:hypothetical protein